MFCECMNWTRTGGFVMTAHHRNCQKYDPMEEISLLEARLASALGAIQSFRRVADSLLAPKGWIQPVPVEGEPK